MTPSAFAWLVVAGVITYVVAVDPNVLDWLVLQAKNLNVSIRRLWFLIRHNPDSPWVRFEIKRNADRMAKEMLKELKNR
jgi:hypothetical protein